MMAKSSTNRHPTLSQWTTEAARRFSPSPPLLSTLSPLAKRETILENLSQTSSSIVLKPDPPGGTASGLLSGCIRTSVPSDGSDRHQIPLSSFHVHHENLFPMRISSMASQPEPSIAPSLDGVPHALQILPPSPADCAPHSPQKDNPEPPVGTTGLLYSPSLLASCGAIFFRFFVADLEHHLCDHSVQMMRTA